MRPYRGYRDTGFEQFALQMKKFEGDGWPEQGTPLEPIGAEARAYGRMWAQKYKNDEDALPSMEEVINGLLNWVCDGLDVKYP